MTDKDLERVKAILVGDIQAAVNSLSQNFESEEFSTRVADVVAEALQKRAEKDDKVSDVLAPTIDHAISSSIDQDPKKLAESLYPIMGPAIRKSISETLQQMLENFNQLLEESLSPKSLRWRFDAWRTGRSYSELVMLNTLEYQIEQVFLIHRETSLLIQHQLSDLADAKDPDMVSGMFSAIQDFIEDSFATDGTNELNTLRLGDLTVVIQRGPSAVVAAVVRGRVPENLRTDIIQLLESLHSRKRAQLHNYSGDPDDFLDIEPDVRRLLQTEKKQAKEEKRKIPWLALVAIAILSCGYGYWYWLGETIATEQQRLLAKLESEPGLVVMKSSLSRSQFSATLLSDPDAIDPGQVTNDAAGEFSISLDRIPYLSLDPEIIQRRAIRVLQPENSTAIEIVGRSVHLSGIATVDWMARADNLWPGITGADGYVTSSVQIVDPALDEINQLINQIESFYFEFAKGESDIDATQQAFSALTQDIRTLISRSIAYGRPAFIDVVGFTDATGTDRINRIIGTERANRVTQELIENGVPGQHLRAHNSQDYESSTVSDIGDRRETRLLVNLSGPD